MEKTYPDCCVFCGANERLSREHIVAQWMRQHLPAFSREATRTAHMVTRGMNDFRRGKIDRPGTITSLSLKCVCAPCNNGWMSRLQKAAKPILIPLLERGHLAPATAAERRSLTRWIMMTAAVNEFADMPTVCLSREHRAQIMNDDLSADWFIGLARYSGTRWQTHFFHRALKIEGEEFEHLAQISFIGLGAFAFVTIGASEAVETIVRQPFGLRERQSLYQLWPPANFLAPFASTHIDDFGLQRLVELTTHQPIVDPLAPFHIR